MPENILHRADGANIRYFFMSWIDVFLLALALSADAFVVSLSYGLIIKKNKGRSALKIASATGLGQFVMPVLGWYGARSVYHQIEAVDHWIAFFVFLVLGLKIINDSLKKCDCREKLSKILTLKILCVIGFATSIDAFVSGSMLYFMQAPVWQSAFTIGIVTFVSSCVGFNFCRMFKKMPSRWLEIASGIILIGLGCKVLYEHLQ